MSTPDPIDGEVVETPAAQPEAAPSTALTPVPSRRPAKLRISRASREASGGALRQLEVTLGGRQKLVDALVLGATTDGIDADRAQYVLGLLADPKFADKSLRTLAKLAGITIHELLKLYRAAAVQRAHLAALSHVVEALPAVTRDVMQKAVPYELECYGCGGVGEVTPEPSKPVPNPGPETCRVCRGAGRLLHQPDLEHQKLALTLGGLLKGAGAGVTIINQQQQAQGGGGVPLTTGDGLLQMQKLSEQALYGPETPDEE